MIVTVTLNPALDLTYPVDALVPHRTHRITEVAERAGGKGLNVARVLHALGEPVLATGLLGGPTGDVVAGLLEADGVPDSFTRIAGDTRRTVAVVDQVDATGFWEPGPVVPAAEWSRFVAHFRGLIGEASVVTLCGSLPPGIPIDAYAVLARVAASAGVPVLLDTSGPALRAGLAAGPAIAKPNAAELAALDPDWNAATLRALTSGSVVVTDGAAGLRAITPDAEFRCVPPVPVTGNPTGAGDACAAALARGLRDGTEWPGMLADAVALGAAAVASPVAGAFDPGVYRELRSGIGTC
ncbi:1-phosphofructokinase family hexose kinase [Actinoplanes regularis]|uniref:Tagatose 6-phosphate kinase n=1 Tax=Actinoplanes regularis TaxID=52697 RepID=A0A238YGB3_9ACTN|nr:hexose kinase [Actinoplanes regularis]GIE85958.1 sugar kinase [Actinoplanes regularis]SNR69409.1 tagatose 6-phosphate kinase [Actinoplanes regularis]